MKTIFLKFPSDKALTVAQSLYNLGALIPYISITKDEFFSTFIILVINCTDEQAKALSESELKTFITTN